MANNNLSSSLKFIGVFSIMMLCTLSANAQFLRTSYFMEGVHYRQQLNPALSPGRGYINIPVVGAFNVSASSKSFGYQDIMDIIDNSDGSDYFTSNDFMKRLKAENQLNINLNTDILSAGWYKGKNFWSLNVGLRVDMGASIPKSMFSFMREMNGVDFGSLDWSHFNHQIGKESLEINSYAEIGLGYTREINDRLAVGGKVKALLGIGNLKLDVKSIGVNTEFSGITPETDWSSLTPEQIANIHGSANIDVEASLESSFKGLNLRNGDNGYVDDFDFEAGDMGIAGYGAAIDLGASYKVLDNLTVSAALLDLGFISWSKGSTSIAKANTEGLSFDSRNEGDIERFRDIVTSGEVLNYDMLHMQVEENAAKSRKTWLHSTMVFGAEYALLDNWLVVGALSTTRFTKPKTMSELTLSANIRPKNYFNVALSYSMLQSAGKSFGLAVKLGPLFVGTDYMFLGSKTKTVNAFLGISIPLGGKKANKQG